MESAADGARGRTIAVCVRIGESRTGAAEQPPNQAILNGRNNVVEAKSAKLNPSHRCRWWFTRDPPNYEDPIRTEERPQSLAAMDPISLAAGGVLSSDTQRVTVARQFRRFLTYQLTSPETAMRQWRKWVSGTNLCRSG